MTILITSAEQDHDVCVFENIPLLPFYKRDRMEKAKYLQWLIDNVNVDPQLKSKAREQEHPQTGQMNTMYPLNHLVRIAGQYPNMGAAKAAFHNIVGSDYDQPTMPSESHFSSDSGQVQLSETLLDSMTVTWNKQRWITIADFFKYVFPRLRPSQQGYLPCLYRSHLNANGELVIL